MICPTGALTERKSLYKVLEALAGQDLYPVIQFSPTVPAAIAEEFGLKSNKDILNLVRAAFKKMGFRQSFDVSLAADLTIMEEAAEFLNRISSNEKFPLFTSCCPAWVSYLEVNKPHLVQHLSAPKSPQQVMGTVIKKYITSSAGLKPEKVFVVSVMPCTAKKAEAEPDHPGNNGMNFLDAVITTRELIKMIKLMGIDFSNLEPEPADTAFSLASSSGRLFGVSGGHLEGLLRTIHFMSSGQELSPLKINELRGLKSKKEARLRISKQSYNVVAVNGLANTIELLNEIESGRSDYKIVEVMACPFGCINGGGQKIGSDEKNLKARMKALYDVDEEEMLKVAHKNPVLTDLYEKFLSKPNSERNRDILHANRTKPPDA